MVLICLTLYLEVKLYQRLPKIFYDFFENLTINHIAGVFKNVTSCMPYTAIEMAKGMQVYGSFDVCLSLHKHGKAVRAP